MYAVTHSSLQEQDHVASGPSTKVTGGLAYPPSVAWGWGDARDSISYNNTARTA